MLVEVPDRFGVPAGLGGVVFALVVRFGGVGQGVVIGVLSFALVVEDIEQVPDVFLHSGPEPLAVFVPEFEIDAGPFFVDLFQFDQVVYGVVGVSAEVEVGQQFTGLVVVEAALQFFQQVFVLRGEVALFEPEHVLDDQGGEGDDDQGDGQRFVAAPGDDREGDEGQRVEVEEYDAGDGVAGWEDGHWSVVKSS